MVKWTLGRWVAALIISVVIVGLGILMLYILPIALSIAIVGIITFLGILVLTNLLSQDPDLSKAEMRRAIAGSSMVVYFTLLSLVTFSKDLPNSGLAETAVAHFTYIVGIIIVFYFGSRSLEKYREAGKDNEDENTPTPPPTTPTP